MGDRVLFQVVSKEEFSPVIYCHWSGYMAEEIAAKLKSRMVGRDDDVKYAAARLVQIACGDDAGNTGFGIWNAEKRLTAADSRGDAGVYLIHADRGYVAEHLEEQ